MSYFLEWLLSPSGGPYPQTGLWGVLVRVKNTPLFAHPVGAALVTLGFHYVGLGARAGVMAAVLAESVNQFYKWRNGAYGQSWAFNVFARLFLAAVGASLVAMFCG